MAGAFPFPARCEGARTTRGEALLAGIRLGTSATEGPAPRISATSVPSLELGSAPIWPACTPSLSMLESGYSRTMRSPWKVSSSGAGVPADGFAAMASVPP